MIQILPTNNKEIEKFEIKEWHGVDIEHYGKEVEWNDKEFLFKAVNNDEIVGVIGGKHQSGIIYIDTIIVAASQRGKGTGRKLIQKTIDFGKEMKAHKIHLITGKEWKSSKFYEALGFKNIATLPNHHFHKDFVIYQLDI